MLSCEIQDEMAFMHFVALVQLEHHQKINNRKSRENGLKLFFGE